MEPYCVIIDGFSSGKYYAQEFKKLGYRRLHVQSRDTVPVILSGCFCTGNYHAAMTHTDMEETLQWIGNHGVPRFIIAGSEPAVNLADSLGASGLRLTSEEMQALDGLSDYSA